MKNINSLKATLAFFLLPPSLMLLYFVLYLFIFKYFPVPENLAVYIAIVLMLIFEVFMFIIFIRHPKEMNLFMKIFLLTGLILAARWNFQYTLLREQGNLFQFINEFGLYARSAPYIKFAYLDSSLLYGVWIDSLAVMTGAPFLLMLIILPSFLALPFFFLWTGFSIFYVITPYSFKEKIFERLKSSLKRKRA